MVVTMASPKISEFSDYEVMFKRHVHDNLLLNSDLRLIDEMKRAKLKELKRDKDLFKSRFSRFSKLNSHRSVSDRRYTGNTTPRATHKPSFLVCKTSPCSLKTWGNLTDLSKEKVDVYRTDVLQSEEAVVSFRKTERINSNAEKDASGRKISSALLPERNNHNSQLFRSQSSLTKSVDISDLKTEKKPETEDEGFHLPDFRQRSSTMPSYCYKTRQPSRNKMAGTETVNKLLYKENACEQPGDAQADEHETHCNQSQPNVTVTDHSVDNSTNYTENGLKVTFDLPENNLVDECDFKQTTSPKFGRKIQRAKSMVIPGNQLLPLTFRRRSYTLDSTSMNKVLQKEKLLVKRESTNKFDMAVRRLSLFDKLLSASMSSTEDDSDTEWAKCYEEMESCRYLRVPGQSIHGSKDDLNLDNTIFENESD